MKKYKKPLLIALVVLDVALITFFLVLSIMILVTVTKYKNQAVANSDLPMFLVLAGNIIGLMLYVRKTTKKEPAKLDDLSEEQKEALRQELLRDLQGGKEEKTAEEKKE